VAGLPLCAPCWFQRVAQHTLGTRTRWRELQELWEAQSARCRYTGAPLYMGENASLDHRCPRSRGGTHHRSNLQWVTKTVNACKASLTDAEFQALCWTVAHRLG
jgi:5-methylcytosine-specific restriction endonuclease McrA